MKSDVRARATSRAARAASLTLSASALLVLHAPAPVQATGGGVASFQECQQPVDDIEVRLARCVSGSMTVEVASGPAVGLALVTFQCAVAAVGDAASTRVTRCDIGGASGLSPIDEMPGIVVGQAGAAVVSTGVTYEACVGGTAYFVDNSDVSGSDCRSLILNV